MHELLGFGCSWLGSAFGGAVREWDTQCREKAGTGRGRGAEARKWYICGRRGVGWRSAYIIRSCGVCGRVWSGWKLNATVAVDRTDVQRALAYSRREARDEKELDRKGFQCTIGKSSHRRRANECCCGM